MIRYDTCSVVVRAGQKAQNRTDLNQVSCTYGATYSGVPGTTMSGNVITFGYPYEQTNGRHISGQIDTW